MSNENQNWGSQDSSFEWDWNDVNEDSNQSGNTENYQNQSSLDDFGWGEFDNSLNQGMNSTTEYQNQGGSLDSFDNNHSDYWQQEEMEYQKQDTQRKEFNFSAKIIGIGIGVLCFLLCVIVSVFDSINIKPKQSNNTVKSSSSVLPDDSYILTEIPNSISLDYSGVVYESSASIVKTSKVLQNNQILYSVQFMVYTNSGETLNLNYYCTYDVYSSLKVGDALNVKYQKVSDGYFSIVGITR